MIFKKYLTTHTLYAFILIFFGIYFIHAINEYWDIIAADEIMYLKFGKDLFGKINFNWGFLYNVWYKFLSLFQYNTIELYYLNYKILIVIIPVLLFICLTVYNIQPFIAFIVAFFFLISKLHVTTWPFVSDFCLLLILLYFIILHFINDKGWKYLFLSFICLLIFLARPEFIVSFILASLFTVYFNRQNKFRLIFLAVFIAIAYYAKTHTQKLGGFDRDFFAYAYHYFFTYSIWHKKEKLDMISFAAMAPKIFGTSYTLVGSILYNPLAFITHVATCTGFYFLSMIKSIEDFLLPPPYFHFLGKIKHLLFAGITGIIIYQLVKRKKQGMLKIQDKDFLAGMMIIFLGACISNFIIGYSLHYVQLHFILYLLIICILLFSNVKINIGLPLQLVLCVILFFCIPSLKKYHFESPDFTEAKNLPVQKLAAFINRTNDYKQHYMIVQQSNLHFAFEGDNFQSKESYNLNQPFLQFVNKYKVDYIYITKQLLEDVTLNKDTEWKTFIAYPEKYRFYKQELPGTSNYLLIKH